MTTEQQLREKLRKITALFEGAATAGERQAAAAAIERIRLALRASVKTEPLPETKFSMPDQWQRRLFSALCRRYGFKPYRYARQRRTTLMVKAPPRLFEELVWAPFGALHQDLTAYHDETTERVIRAAVYADTSEAEVAPEPGALR